MKMDGYTLAEKLRKTRRRHHLSAATQALYYELVAICNEEGWEDVFECSNDELCSALKITEKSLIDYRVSLIQGGLIYYKSGKSKKSFGSYSFIKEFKGCKIYSQSGSQSYSQSGSQSGSQSYSQSVEKAPDYNIGKTKTKTKTKLKLSSDGKPPVKKNDIKVLFWDKLVEAWFIFYKKEYLIEPTFNGAAGSHLKQILSRLEKLTKNKGFDWTEEHSVVCLNHFLTQAHKDQWLQRNFLLSNLSSKFDTIVNPKNNGHSNNSKQPTGGQVDTRAAFDAIDRHFT